jgi:exonuclease VII large subunit
MTTPDIAGLCELLREHQPAAKYRLFHVSADTLERQAAEIERLRETLRQLTENAVCARGCGLKDDEDGIVSSALFDTIMQARAALTGEDTASV